MSAPYCCTCTVRLHATTSFDLHSSFYLYPSTRHRRHWRILSSVTSSFWRTSPHDKLCLTWTFAQSCDKLFDITFVNLQHVCSQAVHPAQHWGQAVDSNGSTWWFPPTCALKIRDMSAHVKNAYITRKCDQPCAISIQNCMYAHAYNVRIVCLCQRKQIGSCIFSTE